MISSAALIGLAVAASNAKKSSQGITGSGGAAAVTGVFGLTGLGYGFSAAYGYGAVAGCHRDAQQDSASARLDVP